MTIQIQHKYEYIISNIEMWFVMKPVNFYDYYIISIIANNMIIIFICSKEQI